MDPNLVHSSCEGATDDNAGSPIVIESLEFGSTLLATGRDFADTNFVADHLDRLGAFRDTPKSQKNGPNKNS